ncbi:PDZ domain-containing protein [Streptomyces sp. NPDC006134]|uniref:PDZ domain-containing protein n=1 Tax=Streptomyces sp. NPDC006134 TaxID=3154467 RepID=UPI0033E9FF62
MEQTTLRPKPMPGQDPGGGAGRSPARRPPGPGRRRRRFEALLSGLVAGTVLVLAGVGLGAAGATVIGVDGVADVRWRAGGSGTGTVPNGASTAPAPPSPAAVPSPARARATLGVEAVDDVKPGAMVVGVHVPGPGYAAGLVRGDVLLAFGTTRIDSAADLAHAVARARPGVAVKLTVRHESGAYQQLTAVPGVVT